MPIIAKCLVNSYEFIVTHAKMKYLALAVSCICEAMCRHPFLWYLETVKSDLCMGTWSQWPTPWLSVCFEIIVIHILKVLSIVMFSNFLFL